MNNVKGFTLIELSIVLVIIGLIVGGVVGGQSLIESARINATTSDFGKYRTAYNAFVLEYDARPGDFDEALAYWSGTVSGDGDGAIESVWTTGSAATTVETYQAWLHLAEANVMSSSSTGAGVTNGAAVDVLGDATVASTWAVPSEIAGGFFHFQDLTIHGKKTNYLNLTSAGLVAITVGTSVDLLTPKQAVQIDRKLDDGVAVTGALRALNTSAGTIDTDAATPATLSCLDNTNAIGGIYKQATKASACTLHYAID